MPNTGLDMLLLETLKSPCLTFIQEFRLGRRSMFSVSHPYTNYSRGVELQAARAGVLQVLDITLHQHA